MSKKVLMIATVPSMIDQFNRSNIDILQGLGYEVHVATDFTDISVWPKERVEKFKNDMVKNNVSCFQINFSRSVFRINHHIKAFKELKTLMEKNKYSFIHTHTPIASAVARLAAMKTKIKVIYTAHGFHFYDGAPIKNWILYYPVEKWLSKYTDILITINKEDYQRAQEKFNAKKTVYIPGVGVDTERFASCKVNKVAKRQELNVGTDDFLLLSVGELSVRKNQKVVIDALWKAKCENILGNIIYLIVGKGDMQEDFQKLISEYGLQDHVKLLGFRTDIDELCCTVDCFIHPSIREGLGIAPLEAMAAGLPLISAKVNGIKDYTENGVSGCCVDPLDKDEVMMAILKMRDDINYRRLCGTNNCNKAKEFDIKLTNKIMKNTYEDPLLLK